MHTNRTGGGARLALAVTPPEHTYRIGVVGVTADAALERFRVALADWPLDPETALRGLLAVDPDDEPEDDAKN